MNRRAYLNLKRRVRRLENERLLVWGMDFFKVLLAVSFAKALIPSSKPEPEPEPECWRLDCGYPQWQEGPYCLRHAIDELCKPKTALDKLREDAVEPAYLGDTSQV